MHLKQALISDTIRNLCNISLLNSKMYACNKRARKTNSLGQSRCLYNNVHADMKA